MLSVLWLTYRPVENVGTLLRRNIVAHNDACVSQQYLTVCERHDVKFEKKPQLRDQLDLTPDYLLETARTLSLVAFMLTHTLWRKVFPGEKERAHESLNNAIFKLMLRRRWSTAAAFGEFGLTTPMTRDLKDVVHRIRIVNTAIALTHLKREADALRLLDAPDWTASLREFALANAILRNKFDDAVQIMIEIGKRGELVNQIAYHSWPLFFSIRETEAFQKAYLDIYGVSFLRSSALSAEAAIKVAATAKLGTVDSDGMENPKS